MLEIGLHGLSFLLTVVVIVSAVSGGKSISGTAGYMAGMILAYCYARTGSPWNILSDKAGQMTATAGSEFNAPMAAVALACFAIWHYRRPKVIISFVLGLLTMSAAEASSGTWAELASILGSFISILAG